ncbi:MAG: hypothetical protein ACO3F7_06360 [Luteolibacter sp.]
MPDESRKPLWLLPNLLSLDAPLVAIAWLHVFVKTWRLGYMPWEAYLVLGLTVWAVYIADRLLDVSILGSNSPKLSIRHQFHQQHRKFFTTALVISSCIVVALVISRMPMSIYVKFLLGGLLVAGFFGLSMLASQDEQEIPHAKNIIAGFGFAFGTAMFAQLYRTGFDLWEMIGSREFLSFAALCVLNISAIDIWEHANRSPDRETKASDELSLTLPLTILAATALASALIDRSEANRPFFYSILTGTALLYMLNRMRPNLSMDSMRVLADVAMLAPVLLFMAFDRH